MSTDWDFGIEYFSAFNSKALKVMFKTCSTHCDLLIQEAEQEHSLKWSVQCS